MTQQLTGMERMLNSLLKAAGFDPEEIKKNMGETIGSFHNSIMALKNRLDTIDARLERIEIALAIKEKQVQDDGTEHEQPLLPKN